MASNKLAASLKRQDTAQVSAATGSAPCWAPDLLCTLHRIHHTQGTKNEGYTVRFLSIAPQFGAETGRWPGIKRREVQ